VGGECALDRFVIRRRARERGCGCEPRLAVAVLTLRAQPSAKGDQLGELSDRADLPGGGDAHEAVCVQVVAEEQSGLVVGRCEQSRLPVVAEVTLVDRLEPEREALVAERREDGRALCIRA